MIAKMSGHPVKLVWAREDDIANDYYRPGGFHFLKGGVDANGKVVAWHDHFITYGDPASNPLRASSAATISGTEFPQPFIENYGLFTSAQPIAIRTGSLRAPTSNALAFVVQSFIDELAHAAGKDPVEFRLDLMAQTKPAPPPGANGRGGFGGGNGFSASRMSGVTKLVAEMSDWNNRKKSLPKGTGLGVAFHFSHSGYFAEVAEVQGRRQQEGQGQQGLGRRRRRPPDHQHQHGRQHVPGRHRRRYERDDGPGNHSRSKAGFSRPTSTTTR